MTCESFHQFCVSRCLSCSCGIAMGSHPLSFVPALARLFFFFSSSSLSLFVCLYVSLCLCLSACPFQSLLLTPSLAPSLCLHCKYTYLSCVNIHIFSEGDIVQAIDNVQLNAKTIEYVKRLIAGPPGTQVLLRFNLKCCFKNRCNTHDAGCICCILTMIKLFVYMNT